MNYRIAEKDGLTVVSIEGEICNATQDDFMVCLNDLCDSSGCRTVLLDMEKVSYLNSAGLGMIIDTFMKFREKGGQLILCGLIQDINRLLEATRLNSFIQIYPSVDDALQTICSVAVTGEAFSGIMQQEVV